MNDVRSLPQAYLITALRFLPLPKQNTVLGPCSTNSIKSQTSSISQASIQKTGPSGEYIFHLFVRPKDVKAEQWDGARSGEQAALDVFNADEVSSHQVLIKNTY